MAKQPFNPAQGRLRLPNASDLSDRAKTNYGVDRLGIVQEPDDLSASAAHAQSLSDALAHGLPSVTDDRQDSPQEPAEELPSPDGASSTEALRSTGASGCAADSPEQQEQALDAGPLAPIRHALARAIEMIPARRRTAALATAAVAALLATWWLAHRPNPSRSVAAAPVAQVPPAAARAPSSVAQPPSAVDQRTANPAIATAPPVQEQQLPPTQPEDSADHRASSGAEPPQAAVTTPVPDLAPLAVPHPAAAPPIASIAPPISPQPASQPQPPAHDGGAPQEWRDSPAGFVLTGIMRMGDNPVAIINNRPVRVGKVINNATVVAISDFSVEMELEGRHFMLGVSATQEVQPVDPSSQDTQATANDDPPVEKPAKKIHKAKKPASKPATPVDEPTEENAEAAQE